MKRSLNRIVCILLCFTMLLPMGCGKKEEAEQEQAQTTGEAEYVYVPEFVELDMKDKAVSSAYLSEEALTYATASAEGHKVYRLPIGESTPKETYSVPENSMISAISQNAEGQTLMLCVVNMMADGESSTEAAAASATIVTLDAAGQQVGEMDVTNVLNLGAEDYIQKMVCDKNGNCYFAGNRGVTVLKPDGTLYFEAALQSYISSMFKLKDDRVVIGYLGDTGWRMETVDLAAKGMTPLESKSTFDYGTYQAGKDTDLIYTMNSMLYASNLSDGDTTQILKWADVDIDSNNLDSYLILEDGRIAVFTMDKMSGEGTAEFVLLSQKLKSEVPQKTVLTYGTGYVPYFVDQDIVAFNKQSDKYRIEVKLYGEDGDYENALNLMNADIAAGKGPDILDLVYSFQDVSNLASKGILEDLAPYMEADAEIKRENYLENVLEAYTINGKLIGIPANVGVDTIVGRTSDVGDRTSWTMKDMVALADQQPETMELLPFATKESMLQTFCRVGINQFVNVEEGTCDFEGAAFKEMLEFVNWFPLDANYVADEEDSLSKIRNKELLLDTTAVTSATLYQLYEFVFEEPVTFIGYPTEGSYGSLIRENGTTAGMYAQSPNKEGVWEFIRFLLSEERQGRDGYANSGFPVMKSALDEKFAKEMEKTFYEDADGNQVEEIKSSWSTGDITVEVYAVTQEQVDAVRALLENAVGSRQLDSQINTIISEEAQAYFGGQKTVDEITPLIQNRVQTYINEIR